MQHKRRGASDAGERAGTSEAERRERLTRLVLCRSRLSPDEAALLRDVFPEIVAAHLLPSQLDDGVAIRLSDGRCSEEAARAGRMPIAAGGWAAKPLMAVVVLTWLGPRG